ncbi:unnamed protein product, partial [Symbiodinium sp. KB8]
APAKCDWPTPLRRRSCFRRAFAHTGRRCFGAHRVAGNMLPLFLKALACLAPLTRAQCDNATASDWLLYDNGASYLNLPEVDNWSRLNDAQTVWRKLKLLQDPQVGDASVIVSLVDATFADVSGAGVAPWGLASDCRGSPFSGTMQINLLNTPFRYEAVLADATGYKAFGSVSCESLQNCSASCGGLCGFCGLGEQTVTQAQLPVIDQCAFDMGVQAWVTTTTSTGTRTTLTSSRTSSVTSSTTTYLGPTSTSTTTTTSVTLSTSATVTSTSTATISTTSSSTTTSTTTQVNGYYYYRFTPTQIADEGGSCCCAHAVAELYFRNCGADVDMALASASNPGGSWQGSPPGNAVDLRLETKWRDSNRRPLILASPELMPVDSYSYVTGDDCPDNDPTAFELHGSQDGVYWEFLDARVMADRPPASWRPAQTEWFTFKNCTPTTTATSLTQTSQTTSSSTVSRTFTVSTSISRTSTASTTTSPEGAFVQLIESGTCAQLSLFPILGPAECEQAARQLDLPDLSAQITAEADRPEGCYFFEGLSLWLGVSPASKGKGAETSGPEANKTRHPICSSVVPDMRVATGLAGNGGPRSGLFVVAMRAHNVCDS